MLCEFAVVTALLGPSPYAVHPPTDLAPTRADGLVRADGAAHIDAANGTAPGEQPPRVRAQIGVTQSAATQRRGVRGIRVGATALLGTGVSLAQGGQRAIANRSPLLLSVDAGFFHPEYPWLEFAPGVLFELERGVSFGVAFRLRAFVPLGRVRPYAMVAAPALVVPTTLFGAQVAAGVAVELHRHFSLAAEAGPTVFFAGKDLASDTVTKLDTSVGIRVAF